MVINPIVGVYIPIIRIPIKGGMTIPNIGCGPLPTVTTRIIPFVSICRFGDPNLNLHGLHCYWQGGHTQHISTLYVNIIKYSSTHLKKSNGFNPPKEIATLAPRNNETLVEVVLVCLRAV